MQGKELDREILEARKSFYSSKADSLMTAERKKEIEQRIIEVWELKI